MFPYSSCYCDSRQSQRPDTGQRKAWDHSPQEDPGESMSAQRARWIGKFSNFRTLSAKCRLQSGAWTRSNHLNGDINWTLLSWLVDFHSVQKLQRARLHWKERALDIKCCTRRPCLDRFLVDTAKPLTKLVAETLSSWGTALFATCFGLLSTERIESSYCLSRVVTGQTCLVLQESAFQRNATAVSLTRLDCE